MTGQKRPVFDLDRPRRTTFEHIKPVCVLLEWATLNLHHPSRNVKKNNSFTEATCETKPLTLPPSTTVHLHQAKSRVFYSTNQDRKTTDTSTWEHAYGYLLASENSTIVLCLSPSNCFIEPNPCFTRNRWHILSTRDIPFRPRNHRPLHCLWHHVSSLKEETLCGPRISPVNILYIYYFL